MLKNQEKLKIFLKQKKGMGIKDLMENKDKDDADSFKCSGTKSF